MSGAVRKLYKSALMYLDFFEFSTQLKLADAAHLRQTGFSLFQFK
jgi:hypothetical protein